MSYSDDYLEQMARVAQEARGMTDAASMYRELNALQRYPDLASLARPAIEIPVLAQSPLPLVGTVADVSRKLEETLSARHALVGKVGEAAWRQAVEQTSVSRLHEELLAGRNAALQAMAGLNSRGSWSELLASTVTEWSEARGSALTLEALNHSPWQRELQDWLDELQIVPRLAEDALRAASQARLGLVSDLLPEVLGRASGDFEKLLWRYEELEHSPEVAIPGPTPLISLVPAIEIAGSASLLSSWSWQESDEEDEDSVLEDEGVEPDSFETLLSRVHPELARVWRGAKQALHSKNPDQVRHVLTSLRELVTHTLHWLAPDERISRWSADPKLYDKGRPTRRARLQFICRAVNHGPFNEFLAADFKSSLGLIDLFHGVHRLEVGFSQHQLRSLVIRTECFLRFLLETASFEGES